jgi:phage protein D
MPDGGAATRDPIYRARPTLRFGGEPDERASNLVQSMRMEEGEGGMRALELGLSNWASTRDGGAELAFDDGSVLRLGAEIEVYGGEVDRPRELFRGRITAIEHAFRRGEPPRILVLAEDALLAARLARRSRVFADQSPADVVRTIAADLGLQPVITALDGPPLTWAQIDETDLAFLRRLLTRHDADLQVVGRELHVSPRADVERGRVSLDLDTDLRAIAVCADLAEQVTRVQARGWDAAAGSPVRAEVERGANLGPGNGRDGPSVLRDAIGERADNLGHLAVRNQEEAQALAEAAFDHRARRFVRARGVTEGNPSLRVGARLSLSGLGTRFDNDYYVVRTCHLFDLREGYRTEFTAECAYLGGNE